jgi:predicted nucleic acid-binding protein
LKLVALDTTVVMVLAGEPSSMANAKERADALVLGHRNKQILVAIPAAALAECSHCDKDCWNELLVLNLNGPAAILANELMRPLREAAADNVSWQCVKFDALILATAEHSGASILYTTDSWFAKVAKLHSLRIEVRDLPPLEAQQSLIGSLWGSPT